MPAYAVGNGNSPAPRVSPEPVPDRLVELVERVQRVPWPLWVRPAARPTRELAELCRLQAARGVTVLSWLAVGAAPEDVGWLLSTARLAGARQERMYRAAAELPEAVRGLVVANWTWALAARRAGVVVASYLASRAYPDDGYAAAHVSLTLLEVWERSPEARPPLAIAWAAARAPADWCKAAELRACHGTPAPVFCYPRADPPPRSTLRPWIARLAGYGR